MLGKGILAWIQKPEKLKTRDWIFPSHCMAPEVLTNWTLGCESGPLVSVILWSAEGRRNAGRAVELLQMAVGAEGGGGWGEPGSSRGLPGSNLFLKSVCWTLVYIESSRPSQPRPCLEIAKPNQTKPNEIKPTTGERKKKSNLSSRSVIKGLSPM